jgi:lactate dehydrogenase-like 2-hydroxyacid dehydrogenase
MRRDHAQANAASAMRHSMYSGMSHLLIRAFAEFHNVMLQLHRSGATVETRTAAAGAVRDNLQTFFNSEPLLTGYTD